jgi:hypothetical protein
MTATPAPEGSTLLEDDDAYQPETGKSDVWLEMIAEAQKTFRAYQDKADGIDKLYANLENLSAVSRDRQFQLFWANVQVLAPSIYARPPVPVVVPKFKDRRPLYRVSSEFVERATVVAFDLADINSTMILLRDDLAIQSRGAAWVRYETKAESDAAYEKVCIEHVDRKDFLHEPSRNWSEVGWVARCCWMTLDELKDRFKKTSGDAYLHATTQILRDDKDNGGATRQGKAAVWEIWSKTENKVVWVTEGVEVTLDEDKPHLKLEGFFPCPRPAFGTTQRRSLIPVPDMLFYKDQLEEINGLTNRIHALSEAIKIKGFYPGGGEIGDAVEAAINLNDDRKIMVPISNWAAFGTSGDQIIWLPIEVIASTVAGLVELRRAVIDDVYQIMGLSDIMRGSTEKDETLGAQQLKAQFGSVRVRDKQSELVRIARDLVRIAAEIMAENFDQKTLLDMSQMEIPTKAEIAKQVKELEDAAKEEMKAVGEQAKQAMQNPEAQQQAAQNPQAAQQQLQQAQQQIMQKYEPQLKKLGETVTIEAVMEFLRDNNVRPFVLDIETDSTIQPDEQAEKEARTEFSTALATLINQFAPMLQMNPAMAPMVGGIIKFTLAPFRIGRELEGLIDEALESVTQQAGQPQPNPEAEKLKAEQAMEEQRMQFEQQKMQADQQNKQTELQMKAQIEEAKLAADMQMKQQESQDRQKENQAKLQMIAAQMQRDKQKGDLEMQKLQMEIEAKQAELQIKAQSAQIDAAMQAQSAEIQASQAQQQAEQSSVSFAQQTKLNAQKAAQTKPEAK